MEMGVAKLSLSFLILALAIFAIPVPGTRAISQQQTSSALAAAKSGGAMMQGVGFIRVEGSTLNTRFENALATGRAASGRTPFWIGYSFDLKPGTGVDINITSADGSKTYIAVASGMLEPQYQTRNAGIFFKYGSDGPAVSRVELYNLDAARDFKYPVYWLGRAGDNESLSLLKTVLASNKNSSVSERLVDAIGLHKSSEVESILKEIFSTSGSLEARKKALFWLGSFEGSKDLLLQVAQNGKESVEVRKQAVEGIGRGDSSQAMSSLESLYDPKKSPDLKLRIIDEASRNANHDVAVTFLFKVAESEPDYNVRQIAISYLARMAGDRSLLASGATGNGNDEETQLQLSVISAILQRPATEAVPFLIEMAKTNPKPLVRERAIRSLAAIQDPRVLKFFREILEK
jgi:HEAT repeat protein